jgi:hypothetical protein
MSPSLLHEEGLCSVIHMFSSCSTLSGTKVGAVINVPIHFVSLTTRGLIGMTQRVAGTLMVSLQVIGHSVPPGIWGYTFLTPNLAFLEFIF